MYGDGRVIRRRASQLREQAVDLRQAAEALVAEAEDVDWRGRAAASMRERARSRAGRLREAAARHDGAATSLEQHAGETDRLRDEIAEVEQRVASRVADARARVDGLHRGPTPPVRLEPDPEDAALLAFTPPPSGHKGWLEIDVPGVR